MVAGVNGFGVGCVMSDYYDPVSKKWSFDNGNPGWHFPLVAVVAVVCVVGSIIGLIGLAIGAF